MKIKITTVGTLSKSLPKGQEVIEGHKLTVQGVLDALVSKYSKSVAEELFKDGTLKKKLSLLVNGRNVSSLPDKIQTLLKDEDEIIISTNITGG